MDEFFESCKEHSIIKSTIVEKYFSAWSKIMANRFERIGYIDLYSGPGIYEDGTESTPIKILRKCVTNDKLKDKIVAVFNDEDPECCENLQCAIDSIPGIENLKYKPTINNFEVNSEIADKFAKMSLIPCFSFIDPFGYKGVTKKLINSLIKDFGCDCLLFFNYNRINSGINNPKVAKHMDDLFGTTLASDLREKVKGLSPDEREAYIINSFCDIFWKSNKYALPFRFISPNRDCTSHYLIFVSKHILGYNIMKEIMARESSEINQGVASFSYIPTMNKQLNFLYKLNMPLNELKEDLIKTFKGQTLSKKEIFIKHSPGTRFIDKNYRDALLTLEAEGKIIASEHRKNTFSDRVIVKFL